MAIIRHRDFSTRRAVGQQATAVAPEPDSEPEPEPNLNSESLPTKQSENQTSALETADFSDIITQALSFSDKRSRNLRASNPPSYDTSASQRSPYNTTSAQDFERSMNESLSNAADRLNVQPFLDLSPSVSTMLSPPPRLSVQEPPIPQLGPAVGKSVMVEPSKGVDLGRAFAKLNMIVARNQIRRDHRKQRFHERPGLRRKRLKSERYRKRFKQAFQTVVKRVRYMTERGW